MGVPLKLRAKAQLELIRRREREKLSSRYDWYGDECECGVALGECRDHPRARPSQRPPGSHRASSDRDDWRIWLLMAGRGFGKTRTAAEFVTREVQAGRVGWVALINETVKDVRDVQIEHPDSGLLAVAPPWFRPIYEPSKARVTWPNGAFATIYSAEQPGALRGPQFGLGWPDELGKWKFGQAEVWSNLQMCLRSLTDPRPRLVVTSTPNPTPTFKEVARDRRAVVTTGTTFENAAHLDPDFVAYIAEKYGGTRLGMQELEARLLEDNPAALWSTGMIEAARIRSVPMGVELVRIVVAIDPNAGSQDPNEAAETGIVVGGKGSDGHAYVLEDASCKGPPEVWGRAALRCYQRWGADLIVAERNNGGDMVEHVIRTIDAGPDHPAGANVPVTLVWASRGKQTRAEPIAALYEQKKAHHVGAFPDLESQMCEWIPGAKGQKSPDRMDAGVWCLSELMLGAVASGRIAIGGRRPGYS